MKLVLGCLLVSVVVLYFVYEIWKRLRQASDEEIVPDRWERLPREVDPKFYWFQVVRMIVVLSICVIFVIACIAAGVFGLMQK